MSKEKGVYTGIIEKDNDGNYFCGEYLLDYKEVEKSVNKLIGYEYSNDDWNNKGMLLMADSYTAKGDLADAQVILETIIDGKPKQIYLDEANAKLQALKAKQAEKQGPPGEAKPEEMKLQNNENESDLFKDTDPSKKQQSEPIEQPK